MSREAGPVDALVASVRADRARSFEPPWRWVGLALQLGRLPAVPSLLALLAAVWVWQLAAERALLPTYGAIVGEFVASDAGLGFLMVLSRTNFDAAMVFAASLTVAAISTVLYKSVGWLEHMLIDW